MPDAAPAWFMKMSRLAREVDDEERALINAVALAQFTRPETMPPYPEHRRRALAWAVNQLADRRWRPAPPRPRRRPQD